MISGTQGLEPASPQYLPSELHLLGLNPLIFSSTSATLLREDGGIPVTSGTPVECDDFHFRYLRFPSRIDFLALDTSNLSTYPHC